MNRSPIRADRTSLLTLAAIAGIAAVAGAQTTTPPAGTPPTPRPAATPAKRPLSPAQPAAPAAQPGTGKPTATPTPAPAPSPSPAPGAPPAAKPPATPTPPAGPTIQPGQVPTPRPPSTGGGLGTTPTPRPITIQGQQAPTPFWWGPTFGRQEVRRRGPIPGAYTPMGRPAVLPQPPRYALPTDPDRQQKEIAYGPLAPPPPSLPDDGIGPIRPITDPNPPVPPRPRSLRHGSEVIVSTGGFERGGDGVFISGRVIGDRFRLGFTVGGSPFLLDDRGFAFDLGRSYRYDYGYRYACGGYPVYYSYSGAYRYYAPIYGQLVTIDPQYLDPALVSPDQSPGVSTQIDESLLPTIERARLALERGKDADAIPFLNEHLAQSDDDTDAMRLLAAALLNTGKPHEGVALMMLAYVREPELAARPLSQSSLGGDAAMEARATAAVAFANRQKTSSAYFVAAVLAQGAERFAVARRMLDRAHSAGLDRVVWSHMSTAIPSGKP